MAQERIQKILALRTGLSRRHAESAIREGRVKLNGVLVTELGTKADPATDTLELDGEKIPEPNRRIVVAYHKPRSIITSRSDPEGRTTIMDTPGIDPTLKPVGRLDYDSEGLLLLTNDGELHNALTHPKYQVTKTYLVKVKSQPSPKQINQLLKGVKLEDGWTHCENAEVIEEMESGKFKIALTVTEGRNRMIRRILDAVGIDTLRLRRIKMGPITLDNLRPGTFRELTESELQALDAYIAELKAK